MKKKDDNISVDHLTQEQQRFCEQYVILKSVSDAIIHSQYHLQPSRGNAFYVYLLIDPRTDQIFYIGKGKGNRSYMHITKATAGIIENVYKHSTIMDVINSGHEVTVSYFANQLEEDTAFKIETALIKHIGTDNLTNISGGRRKPSDKDYAKYNLSIMKPFEVWRAEKDRTSADKELYHSCKRAWEQIAEHGEQTTLVPGKIPCHG
jgi:hypothetical protein